jgi:uncharacterized protein YecE (DUF72 family)
MATRGKILVGTSSWTDKTLLESGWYPDDATTPEARLQHYATQFPLVEVDSTYYALPAERNAALWVERTPKHFTFNIKAYALLTQHPTRVASLPKALRETAGAKATVYQKDLPRSIVDEVFEMFRRALMPLHSAGKLGCVLFQFPEWFVPNRESKGYVESLAARLPDYRIAVEFRRHTWMDPDDRAQRTLAWLSELGMPYVCLDMPKGFPSSMPPVVAATSDQLAVVRFHGRNTDTWKKKGLSAAERFDYLYSKKELKEWEPRMFELAGEAREVHALFNNCYRDKGVRNAADLAGLLRNLE